MNLKLAKRLYDAHNPEDQLMIFDGHYPTPDEKFQDLESKWAARLGMTNDELESAILTLTRLGLLTINKGGWEFKSVNHAKNTASDIYSNELELLNRKLKSLFLAIEQIAPPIREEIVFYQIEPDHEIFKSKDKKYGVKINSEDQIEFFKNDGDKMIRMDDLELWRILDHEGKELRKSDLIFWKIS